ncbi:MAG: prolyl oligopeptidase family serine peptidase [Actinomycetota bacterium]|nr:prolyl oligopeptidase family serine peptidase [Actinomycetota bacterium]
MVDILHGVEVADPYRWLEQGDSEEVAAWVAAQNDRTRAVLDALPVRRRLHARFLDLLELPSVGAPIVAGDRVFTLERAGDLDQAVVVLRSAVDRDEPARVLVDPHDLAADHAAAVDFFSPSPAGRLLAYGVSQAGSEHGILRVVDVDSGELRPDAITPVRHPSVAWLPDGSAFAYSRLPDPDAVPDGEEGYWERPYWHVLGEDPVRDAPLFGDDLDKTALPMASISPDGRWLALHVHLMPTRTDVILVDRQTGERTVVVEGEEATTWADVVGDRLYAVTNLDAPRGRVVTAPVDRPQVEHWEAIVGQGTAVVDTAVVAGDSLLVATTDHAVSRLWRYGLDGSGGEEIPLPELGSLEGLDADPAIERAFLTFTSFSRPPALWRWTPEAGLEPWSDTGASASVDPTRYRVEQVFYPSTDGADVPMFLVRRADVEPLPATPAVLTGYGGFAISSTPGFSPGLVAWCDAGGMFAVAGIRGGGEYGEDWHRAGMLHNKQQVFDDFAAAAEWLVGQGRTRPESLAIRGGSNGGLLVGATIVQRPDLCCAALCAVPLLDMLRYHRFLIGGLWVPEYGDPDDPDDFAVLHAYSPYHHVAEGVAYPAVLIATAESDSRVDPMHARKFAAMLQAATTSGDDRPVLLRIETRAGHGLGKPRWKQADELADMWAFLFWQLGLA